MKAQPDIIAHRVAKQVQVLANSPRLTTFESGLNEFSADISVLENSRSRTEFSTQPLSGASRDQRTLHRKREWTEISPLTFQSTSGNYSAAFRPPLWLTGLFYAWELNIAKSLGDWKTSLRTYSFRPLDSDIFRFAKQGDVGALQRTFSLGEASPYDRSCLGGMTLLHVSVHFLSALVADS